MTISAATERIPLPRTRGPVQLTLDALAHRIRLTPSKKDGAAALFDRVAKHIGFLCPRVELKDGGVELTCRAARVEAEITPVGHDSYLDINELRGLPWRTGPDAPPRFFYDPWRTGLGQSCPGKSPGARGECELNEGRVLEAAIQFRDALHTTARQMACVRLGDLALATGDPITAAGWYRRAGAFSAFGRIAEARLCELDGKCLVTTEQVLRTFDSTGLPEPLRAEMTLRASRAEAYAGRLPSAAHILARQVRAHGMASVCREDGELLCRRILLEAMRAARKAFVPGPAHLGGLGKGGPAANPPLEKAERAYLEELVEVYLSMPAWDKGPRAVEMAQAAAPLAARLGAPAFGGNLLASLAPEVPDAQLADHLLLAAETFLQGDNWARARIVAEYAQIRLAGRSTSGGKRKGRAQSTGSAKGGLNSPRWNEVFRAVSSGATQDEVSPGERAAIEAEFATTMNELKRARETAGKAQGILRGTRDAQSSPPAPAPSAAPAAAPLATPAPAPAPSPSAEALAKSSSPEGRAAAASPAPTVAKNVGSEE